MNKAIQDIAAERERQVSVEGWTPEHDDEHGPLELARAGAAYALQDACNWPWNGASFKLKDCRQNLVRAGALIAAAIEAHDRAAHPKEGA